MGGEPKVILQTVLEGGSGGEAEVWVQLRNSFPGIGGVISTNQVVVVARRKDYSPVETVGEGLFLKHLVIKKLDDFFCRVGKYTYPHIARPLGSEENIYFYEWVHGSDHFVWTEIADGGVTEQIVLEEWSEFVTAFSEAGISIGHDVSDSDNANVSQNIVHQLCRTHDGKLNRCWKRIDFGSRSLIVDYDKLESYVDQNRDDLKSVLGDNRYWLLVYSLKALRLGSKLDLRDRTRLEELIRLYRVSTLRHHQPRLAIQ